MRRSKVWSWRTPFPIQHARRPIIKRKDQANWPLNEEISLFSILHVFYKINDFTKPLLALFSPNWHSPCQSSIKAVRVNNTLFISPSRQLGRLWTGENVRYSQNWRTVLKKFLVSHRKSMRLMRSACCNRLWENRVRLSDAFLLTN